MPQILKPWLSLPGLIILSSFISAHLFAQCNVLQSSSTTNSAGGVLLLGQSFKACMTGKLNVIRLTSASVGPVSNVTLKIYDSASGFTNEIHSEPGLNCIYRRKGRSG